MVSVTGILFRCRLHLESSTRYMRNRESSMVLVSPLYLVVSKFLNNVIVKPRALE